MFGFNLGAENDKIVSLDLHSAASGNRQTTITRNRDRREQQRGDMDLFQMADRIVMRFRIGELASKTIGRN